MPGFWDDYRDRPPEPKKEERPMCRRCLVAPADRDTGMCYWCYQIESNKQERCPGCGKTGCTCPW